MDEIRREDQGVLFVGPGRWVLRALLLGVAGQVFPRGLGAQLRRLVGRDSHGPSPFYRFRAAFIRRGDDGGDGS